MKSQLSNSASSTRWGKGSLLQSGDFVSYSFLAGLWRRSLRNGGWRRLEIAERGLFRCALWVAKARGQISNTRLMVHVIRIALKMLEDCRSRIAKAGRRRVRMLYETYARPGGVFSWAPRMRTWLNDPRYVLYLGLLQVDD